MLDGWLGDGLLSAVVLYAECVALALLLRWACRPLH